VRNRKSVAVFILTVCLVTAISPPTAFAALPRNEMKNILAADVFDYRIVMQPEDMPNYVSVMPNVVTFFNNSAKEGSKGFLAHNIVAGIRFPELYVGQKIYLVYESGVAERFEVDEILRFQALTPGSVTSNFKETNVELVTFGRIVSADWLFHGVYGKKDHLILQTCIKKDKEPNWGYLFIIAKPDGLTSLTEHTTRIYTGE
jgi:hypothetical protein